MEVELLNLAKKVNDYLNQDSFNYWDGFKAYPYAIYNKTQVLLVNHKEVEESFSKLEEFYIGNWDSRFVGNTFININGNHTAIMDIASYSTFEGFYAELLHEMFHCFQVEHFKFFEINDMLSMIYPINEFNINLLLEERKSLLKALFTDDIDSNIIQFVTIRQKRIAENNLILSYDYGLESIEGIATYIQYLAYKEITGLNKQYVLAKFVSSLEDGEELLSHFRFSFFAPGIAMCVLLDEYYPKWKEEFTYLGISLFDYFKNKFPKEKVSTADYSSYYGNNIVSRLNSMRKQEIEEFEQSKGYKIIIKGTFQISGFDPMNLVSFNKKLLHKSFLRFKSGQNCYFINGMVMTHRNDDLWKVSNITFYIDTLPIIEQDKIVIPRLGKIKGEFREESNEFIIKLFND